MNFLDLIYNLSMLTMLALFFIFISEKWYSHSKYRFIFFGLLFGLITVIGMIEPFEYSEGVFFDGRTIILGLSGFFGGPIAAIISSIIAATYRMELGGSGYIVGILTIFASSGVGVLFYYLFFLKNKKQNTHIFFVGFLIHLISLLLMLFLPEQLALNVFSLMIIPYLLIFPIIFFILAKIFLVIESSIVDRNLIIKQEERYRFATEASADGIWDWNLETNEVYFSPSFKAILGYTDDEMLNIYEEWEKRIHPDDKEQIFMDVDKSINNKSIPYVNVHRLQHKDGHWIWIESKAITLFDENEKAIRMTGSHTNITESKLLEEKLNKASKEISDNNEKFQKLTENIPSMLYQFKLSPDGISKFTYVSNSVMDIYEMAPEELKNDVSLAFKCIHKEDIQKIESSIEDSAKTMEEWNLEYRVNLPKKGLRWLHAHSKPEKLDNGTIVWYGFIDDITNLKLIEIDNKKKEQLLTQQSKMATMGEMIGNIAHQWKQPLSLISMSNGLLKLNQEDITFSSEEEIKKAITNIDISVEHLSNTIDDFRNFFIPDKQKVYFQLKTIYEKTYRLISSQFKNNDIQILVELEDVEIFGYPNELLQVLINIMKNARDELVKSKTDNKKLIFINGYKENEKIILKIKDNAGGIPKNITDEIFNAYFTTKKESEGTGIGLYMSKQIIEHMDGIIKVSNVNYKYEDKEYLGAEFVIELKQ